MWPSHNVTETRHAHSSRGYHYFSSLPGLADSQKSGSCSWLGRRRLSKQLMRLSAQQPWRESEWFKRLDATRHAGRAIGKKGTALHSLSRGVAREMCQNRGLWRKIKGTPWGKEKKSLLWKVYKQNLRSRLRVKNRLHFKAFLNILRIHSVDSVTGEIFRIFHSVNMRIFVRMYGKENVHFIFEWKTMITWNEFHSNIRENSIWFGNNNFK